MNPTFSRAGSYPSIQAIALRAAAGGVVEIVAACFGAKCLLKRAP
jgi:hypothetical protein